MDRPISIDDIAPEYVQQRGSIICCKNQSVDDVVSAARADAAKIFKEMLTVYDKMKYTPRECMFKLADMAAEALDKLDGGK